MKDYAIKIMSDLPLETKFILVGHSMGGYVALAMAELFPSEIHQVVMLHSSPFADTEEKKTGRQRTIDFLKKYPVKDFLGPFILNLFAPKFAETHNELRNNLNNNLESKNIKLDQLTIDSQLTIESQIDEINNQFKLEDKIKYNTNVIEGFSQIINNLIQNLSNRFLYSNKFALILSGLFFSTLSILTPVYLLLVRLTLLSIEKIALEYR
jgi:esterase/lipase